MSEKEKKVENKEVEKKEEDEEDVIDIDDYIDRKIPERYIVHSIKNHNSWIISFVIWAMIFFCYVSVLIISPLFGVFAKLYCSVSTTFFCFNSDVSIFFYVLVHGILFFMFSIFILFGIMIFGIITKYFIKKYREFREHKKNLKLILEYMDSENKDNPKFKNIEKLIFNNKFY